MDKDEIKVEEKDTEASEETNSKVNKETEDKPDLEAKESENKEEQTEKDEEKGEGEASLEDKIKELKEAFEKEKEELNNRYLRLQADFDNFRKRTIKEKEEIVKYALADFAEKMLPVIDNMERAMASIEEKGIDDPYVDGVKMVFTQLTNALKSEGLEEIEAENAEFDPQLHHGVAVEDVDGFEDNQIVEVYQKGYKYKDKVIRPAMVKICKK